MWRKLFGGGQPTHTQDSIELIQKNIANGDAVMLDVRSQKERDAGFIAGSIFIPITDLKELPEGVERVSHIPDGKIIYCH